MVQRTDGFHLGVTGFNAAGKGEVTRYLSSHGFTHLSLSDYLRTHAKNQGLEASRANLTALGQSLREAHGPGFLAQWAVDDMAQQMQAHAERRFVIDSIRHPEEIKLLKQHLPSFFLLGVTAPVALRFARSQKRGRNENAQTVEEFQAQEAMETSNKPNAQQLHRCMTMTDHTLVNDQDTDHLHKKIQDWLAQVNG